jgi:ATP-dependent exoDNAse (exonuclease V) beta subunit
VVILVDFLSSMKDVRSWRLLLKHLEHLEAHPLALCDATTTSSSSNASQPSAGKHQAQGQNALHLQQRKRWLLPASDVALTEREDRALNLAELPEFDEERHAALPGELKLLYVAVTRAKANL